MSRHYVPLKDGYYIPLKELPEYCCQCPCSTEGFEYDMDSGINTATYVECRITRDITAYCALTDLYPDWNAVPRPDNCPIIKGKILPVNALNG